MKFNGKNLKAMRTKKNMSQADLAAALAKCGLTKITRASVNQWECGAGQPSGKSLHALCTVFGVNTSAFYN